MKLNSKLRKLTEQKKFSWLKCVDALAKKSGIILIKHIRLGESASKYDRPISGLSVRRILYKRIKIAFLNQTRNFDHNFKCNCCFCFSTRSLDRELKSFIN